MSDNNDNQAKETRFCEEFERVNLRSGIISKGQKSYNYFSTQVDWNMGEFFILAKFQGKGVAHQVASEIFKTHPGKWSVAVMPENIKAVKFWRKAIHNIAGERYREVFKTAEELKTPENPDPYAMIIFTFGAPKKS